MNIKLLSVSKPFCNLDCRLGFWDCPSEFHPFTIDPKTWFYDYGTFHMKCHIAMRMTFSSFLFGYDVARFKCTMAMLVATNKC